MRKIFTAIVTLTCFATVLDAQQRISLQDCLEMCESGNPYVRNSKLDIQASKAMKSEVMWSFFPDVSINGLGYYAQKPLIRITPTDLLGTSDLAWTLNNAYLDIANRFNLRTNYSTLHNGYALGLMAVQPIYAGGRIINGNRLASVGVRASELQADLKLRDLKEEIEGKYWLVVSLQEKAKTLDKAESVLDSAWFFVTTARDAGLVAPSDVTELSHKRSELASGKVKLRSGIKLAKMDLFNAIGMEYQYFDLDNYVLSETIDGLSEGDGLTGEESGVPIEVKLLDMQQEAKELEKKVSVGEFLPEVGVGLSYGYGDMQGNGNGKFNGVGFVSVKIPLTGIGKAASRARRMDYEIQKVSNEREYLDEQLQLQRRKLFLDIETSESQAEVSREALKDAEEAQRRCLADYEAGRVTVTDLLQAELEFRTASEKHIDDCIEYRKAVNAYRCRYCEQQDD